MSPLGTAIKRLHARKDRAYAGAWKRRGEQISVLPNIARKVDRLAVFSGGGVGLDDESVLDTAIDLHVYCLKYELFLADQEPDLLKQLPISKPVLPLSDRSENFDALVDVIQYDEPVADSGVVLAAHILDYFEKLWPAAARGAAIEERFALSRELVALSTKLIARLAVDEPDTIARFIRAEQGNNGETQ